MWSLAFIVNNGLQYKLLYTSIRNNGLIKTWVEKFLINDLKPSQVAVMDNLSFHKSNKTQKLIEKVDYKLIFLPPSSLNLNSIEKFWANMKRWIL